MVDEAEHRPYSLLAILLFALRQEECKAPSGPYRGTPTWC